jgi:hypothetical protein
LPNGPCTVGHFPRFFGGTDEQGLIFGHRICDSPKWLPVGWLPVGWLADDAAYP